MTPQQMEAKAIAEHAALVGVERMSKKLYYQRALCGSYGPVSEAGRAWMHRLLVAMGERF